MPKDESTRVSVSPPAANGSRVIVPTWLTEVPPALAAAVIAAVVSVTTTILSTTLKYWYDTRHHSRKLELEYRYEQSKKLRDHIALNKGRLLEACDSLNHRFWNYYANESHGWLALGDRYTGDAGYYARSFAYRLLAVFSLVRQVEAAALYIDATVAQPTDLTFIKVLKLYLRTWTQVELFEGIPYNSDDATDHFFSDELRGVADAFRTEETILSLKTFEERIQTKDHPFTPILTFLDGLSASEPRLRHDRVVAAHLVLLAFLNRFGYDFQRYDDAALTSAAEHCKPQVLANLGRLIRRMGLADDPEFGRLVRLLDSRARTAPRPTRTA
jgi:hypothetical protein